MKNMFEDLTLEEAEKKLEEAKNSSHQNFFNGLRRQALAKYIEQKKKEIGRA
jgi:hypothetical protein